ncbi:MULTISPECIES: hypothetical protein [Pseudomonas]|uniref:Replication protein n=1 Tax=Pseudomonas lutea TaxID=243924 RepID=A0A9X8MH66_9PSED|nr:MULTISPECIES: hypothetical protein [Pseudomonas]SER37384.1 hypothetical protein SAMN05216409_11893 [Pseudomonas lutea]
MSLLFKFRPLVISPQLAERIGLNEAIVLQQLCYWLVETDAGYEHEGRKWIYNTLSQWQKQFPFWGEDTIKRTMASLKNKGVILAEQLNKHKHDRTNFYTIVFENPLLSDEGNLHSSSGGNVGAIDKGNLHSSDEGNLPPSSGADCTALTDTTTYKTHRLSTETTSHVPSGTSKAASKAEVAEAKRKAKADRQALVAKIFEHWRTVCETKTSRLDAKRTKIIEKALEEYTVEQVIGAISGCSKSDFHMARNKYKGAKKYIDLSLIFRDAEHTERFLGINLNPEAFTRQHSREPVAAAPKYDPHAPMFGQQPGV